MIHSIANIQNETLLPLAQAVEAATGKKIHPSTPSRWGSQGIAGVKLETVSVGGRRYSSKEAALRFVNAVTEQKNKNS